MKKEDRICALVIAISSAIEIIAFAVGGEELVLTIAVYIGAAVGIIAALGIGVMAYLIDERDKRLGEELLPLDF